MKVFYGSDNRSADFLSQTKLDIFRGVAQLVARDIWDVDAAGSNPVTPTISSVHNQLEGWK